MDEESIQIVRVIEAPAVKHELGKLMLVTILAFAATKIGELVYDVAVARMNNQSVTFKPPTE